MAKVRFKKTLLRIIRPALEPLGYEFFEIPEWSGAFLFRKHLWDDVYAFVNFLVHPMNYPPNLSFTIDLNRNRGEEPKLACADYEIGLDDRLPLLLQHHHKLNVYPYDGQWWEYSNREELETQLRDALEKLVTYGLPWLEDPASRSPHLKGPDRSTIEEFSTLLKEVVVPALRPYGYEFVENELPESKRKYFYFQKWLCAETHSFVPFWVGAKYEGEDGRLGANFGVSLARNPGPTPTFGRSGRMLVESDEPWPEGVLQRLAEKGTNRFFIRTDKPWPGELLQRLAKKGIRMIFLSEGEEFPTLSQEEQPVYTSLHQVLEEAGCEIVRQPGNLKTSTWRFHDREELRVALLEATQFVIEYGLPWIEDLDNVA